MAAADRLLASATGGSGGGLLVVGEAGIGKTRLLVEVADRARSVGFTVLTAVCVPGGGTYRALTEAIIGAPAGGTSLEAPSLRPYRAALGGWRPAGTGRSRPVRRCLGGPGGGAGRGSAAAARRGRRRGPAASWCWRICTGPTPTRWASSATWRTPPADSPVVIAVSAWDDQPGRCGPCVRPTRWSARSAATPGSPRCGSDDCTTRLWQRWPSPTPVTADRRRGPRDTRRPRRRAAGAGGGLADGLLDTRPVGCRCRGR